MNGAEMEAMTQRLDRLERQNRRWKAVGLTAVGVLGLIFLMGQVTPESLIWGGIGSKGTKVAEEVRAGRFVVVDERDKVRAALIVHQNKPVLALYDMNERNRAGLSLSQTGPDLVLYDAKGIVRVGVALDQDPPGLRLYDARGKTIWSVPRTQKAGGKTAR